jgi:methyltransferase (TIGR00027 family)
MDDNVMSNKISPALSVGATARWTAAVRAYEQNRPDPLFVDPWAAELAGEEGKSWMQQRTEGSVLPIILRTRFFDDYLQRITAENGIQQVVLMAAGLDTRVFRLNWPAGTQLYELDQSHVLRYKEQALQSAGARPTCLRRSIEADLSLPWEETLVQAGFVPELPSVWLLEGFLFYLPLEVVVSLFDAVTRVAAAGSQMGFDIINPIMLTHPMTRTWIEMQAKAGAPWLSSMDNPRTFLEKRGWQATLTQAGQPDANFGRWPFPVYPIDLPEVPHNWFVTAVKQ